MGTQRLVAICATPPHFNPGMHLVDLALDAVLKHNGIDVSVERQVPYAPGELRAIGMGSDTNYGMPFDVHTFDSAQMQLADADAIVFWGDFQHSRDHRRGLVQLLATCRGVDAEAAREYIDTRVFLRDQQPDILARTLVFGEALQVDSEDAHEHDAEYTANVERLFSTVAAALMRDPISAHRAAVMRGMRDNTRGVDPAMLLTANDLRAIGGETSVQNGAGVFFSRSAGDLSLELGFAKALCAPLGETPTWLPWGFGDTKAAQSAWPELAIGEGTDLTAAVRSVAQCRVVITDTYHLALTAWVLGVPAICVGRGASRFTESLSDKKKELLYEMLGCSALYVFTEDVPILMSESSALDRIVSCATDRQMIDSVAHNIDRMRDSAESAFISSLNAVLQASAARATRALQGVVAPLAVSRRLPSSTPSSSSAATRSRRSIIRQLLFR